MAKDLVSILGWESRTAGVQDPAGGVPDAALPPGFFTLTTPVAGFQSHYDKSVGVRQTGTIKAYDSGSTPAPKVDTVQQPVTLIHGGMHHTHGATLLRQLMDENANIQKMGEAELNKQTLGLRQRYINLRKAAVHSVLGTGHIFFNMQELLGSSAGNTIDVDFAPVTGNANIGAWNTSATDIQKQIKLAKIAFAQDTGLQIRHCIYGSNVLGYLCANDCLQQLINGNPAFAQSFGFNTIPNGFLELQWWSGDQMWFQDANSNFQSWIADDQITLVPEPSPLWYEIQEGTYPVPTALGNVGTDAAGMLGNFEEVRGMFAFAQVLSGDPVGVKQVVGDTFLPIPKVTGSIRIVTDVTAAVA